MITTPSANAAAGRAALASVANCPRFVARQEYFGGVLYDRAGVGSAAYLTPAHYACLANPERGLEDGSAAHELQSLGVVLDPATRNYEVWPMFESPPRGMLRAPIRLYFEATRGCNLQCRYCFNASGPKRAFPDELTTGEAVQIIEQLRRDHVPELRLTGGEIMVRADSAELIRHAHQVGLAVSVNTNAAYDSGIADQLIATVPNLVIVSLDGIDEPQHQDLRGTGHAQIIENARRFRAAGLKVRVNMSLNRATVAGNLVERSVAFFAEHDLEVCLILLRPSGRATDDQVGDSFLLADELYRFIPRIQALRERFPTAKIGTSFDILSPREVRPAPDLDLNTCAAGVAGCNINSRGDFAACAFLAEMAPQFNWGNIRDTGYSVLPFWRQDPRLQEFRERSVAKAQNCVGCPSYRNGCHGTCIVQEYWRDLRAGRFDIYCLNEVEVARSAEAA